ncbi:DUF2730 family protein [Desulfocurvibacter africanus]|uniref:DUF2730 family protein n=1 Tax=Desulfocurvibacter africanus TaxID=873 RepID=UPI002FD8E298
MSWDRETIEFILRVVQVLVLPFGLWVVREILALRKDHNALEGRVCRNEQRLDELPDDKAVHQLALSIEALRGDVRAIDAKIGGLEAVIGKLDRILERQETYLLNGGADR